MHSASSVPVAFWGVLSQMAPYLLFGFLAAGVLSVVISPRFVARHLGGRGVMSVLKASAFGVPLPLCSCSVIPVATSLRRHGAGKGATTAFLISAPQTGVDSILVTFSLLGGVFAVFRPIAALLSGLVGGVLVELVDRDCDTCAAPSVQEDVPSDPRGLGRRVFHALRYGFLTLPEDIGKALLVGLVVAALISAAAAGDFFATALGGRVGGGIVGMLVMMLLGVPVYVCATASVPIAAALIAKGVSPGAALAFLMTGPATNAATIVTVWKVMGVRTGIAYLVTIMGTAHRGRADAGCDLRDLVAAAPRGGRDGHDPALGWFSRGGGVARTAGGGGGPPAAPPPSRADGRRGRADAADRWDDLRPLRPADHRRAASLPRRAVGPGGPGHRPGVYERSGAEGR